jgi:putative PIN family toxin of toxin-antitoxin system
MITAVYDCNVLIAAIGWGGNPRHCLQLVAGGQVRLVVTDEVWAEYKCRVPEVLAQKRPEVDPHPALEWLHRVVVFVEGAPLGKRRSRDPKDDPYLSCALGARAETVVTGDRDLLVLGKPFGVSMMTPVAFLKWVRERSLF